MNKKKILYIDDEELNVKLFAHNFSRNFDVVTGLSGIDGLALLEKNPDIKVVISDMKMPYMHGLEFIAIASEKYREKKYFILTGFDITEEIQHALDSKLIVKYFSKPLNVKEIETAINEVLLYIQTF
ncbi:MAG: response regulator [Bacteroidales bacterium]|nr:response regulator [Bacteroidales bacterium]